MIQSTSDGEGVKIQEVQEITNERYGDTINKCNGTLNEIKEDSPNSRKCYTNKTRKEIRNDGSNKQRVVGTFAEIAKIGQKTSFGN